VELSEEEFLKLKLSDLVTGETFDEVVERRKHKETGN
jgi:hypothetical protein